MRTGVAHIDITPPVGIELCGFVSRRQPSLGMHDPLGAHVSYLEDDPGRILWIHADLIGFDSDFIDRLKLRLGCLGLEPREIVLSASHTHSGPATMTMLNCGEKDPEYLEWLEERFETAALLAMRNVRPAKRFVGAATCDIAADRRGVGRKHVDPRLNIMGWRDNEGRWIAILANYPMHNIALGPESRVISADVAGRAAASLSAMLPGGPVVLWTNGACGNLNPPSIGADFARIEKWGDLLADRAVEALASPTSDEGTGIDSLAEIVEIPLQTWTTEEIEAVAETLRGRRIGPPRAQQRYLGAIEAWRKRLLSDPDGSSRAGVRLQTVRIGDTYLVCIGAEVFCMITPRIEKETGAPVWVVGYANGTFGYIPPASAFEEGGYEVDTAFVFYGSRAPAPGALDILRARAVDQIRRLRSGA